jgi:plasmid maintenance system antidote protein VapI
MKTIDGEGLKKLVNERFNGNMNTCARVLNVSHSTISRVISGKRNPGGKLIYSIVTYCNKREIDYNRYL